MSGLFERTPEEIALLLVQQYLSERRMMAALKETEASDGLKFVESKLPSGSLLLQLIYDYMERQASLDVDEAAVAQQNELEDLLQGGASDYPCEIEATIQDSFSATVTAVTHCEGGNRVITGTGSGDVQSLTKGGEEVWQQRLQNGGAISLAIQPNSGPDNPDKAKLLVGSMDGTVSLLDAATGAIHCKQRVHTKYVVKVLWSPTGSNFLTASWDGKACLFSYKEGDSEFTSLGEVPFATAIQDVIFLPGDKQLLFALRDSNYLRVHRYPEIKDVVSKVNMNALGDDHVSFSARQLAIHPKKQLLLVSTDSPRILLLRLQDWSHLPHHIFGLPMDKFHNCSAQWHKSGYYIMAAAAAGFVYIFHTGTGKVISSFKAHEQNVRWLDYIPESNTLISCSFDKTVKFWRAVK